MIDIPGTNLELYTLIYVPLIIFLTKVVVDCMPENMTTAKYGPLVSVLLGLLISLLDMMWGVCGTISPAGAIIRGLLAAAAANGIYDHAKAGKSLIKSTGENS